MSWWQGVILFLFFVDTIFHIIPIYIMFNEHKNV
jgi:hypothetical protein